jgi:hypothetical protein
MKKNAGTKNPTKKPAETPSFPEQITLEELSAVIGGEQGNYYERGYATAPPGT